MINCFTEKDLKGNTAHFHHGVEIELKKIRVVNRKLIKNDVETQLIVLCHMAKFRSSEKLTHDDVLLCKNVSEQIIIIMWTTAGSYR